MSALDDVLIVEDHASVVSIITQRITSVRDWAGELTLLDHQRALRLRAWGSRGGCLISAHRHPRAQDNDPTLPLLAGPEVVAGLREAGFSGPLIVYGSRADWPEVNITARQAGATAVYTEIALVRDLPRIVAGQRGRAEVPPPTDDDFRGLGLEPGARLWEAIVAMRHVRLRDVFAHGDAWERVALTDPTRKIDDRTREYINDKVGPLLGITEGHGRHRRIAELIGSVVGLPAQRSATDAASATSHG